MTTDELQDTLVSSAAGEELVGTALRPGDRVGRYVIEDKLGAGGMGEVFAAHDPELDRRVALKLLKPSSEGEGDPAQQRMLREAQALAKLSHPNVVAVYDAGTHGDRIFIAMEYLEGRTLSAWLRERTRAWAEVLPLLLHAGEGLLAAHREGIVHRDFKPANVMVDDAGQARVLDFGLARRFEGGVDDSIGAARSPADASSDRLPISSRLTQTGVVMGTPAFMAPEQFGDDVVDARADQFSFCVVLYRALWGHKPFSGGTYVELRRSVQAGLVREPPRDVPVPAAIRRAVLRGLSVWPRDRHPTMEALLHDLRRGIGASRRRRMIALVVLGTATLAAGAVLLAHRLAPAPCRGAPDRVAAVWGTTQRAAVTAAFLATSLPYADDVLESVHESTDTYARDWIAMYEEACASTRVQGDQSEQLLDRRMSCLDDRIRSLGAWVDLLAGADAEVVRNATQGAAELPAIRDCGDRSALAEPMQPPAPTVAVEVEAIRGELAAVRALGQGGRFKRATGQAEALLERARALDYPPLHAEVALTAALVADRAGNTELARTAFEEALLAAEIARHDRVRAEALIGLTNVLGYRLHEHDAAIQHARHAEAVLARLDDVPVLRGTLELYRGNTEYAAGHPDLAVGHFSAALAVVEADASAWQLKIGALSNLAAARASMGDVAQGVAALESARAVAVERVGEMHPIVAVQDTNLAGMYSRLERHDEALASIEHALATHRAEHGDVHADTGRALNVLGLVLTARGDDEGALAAYQRSLRVKEQASGADPSLAISVNNVGNVLLRLHRAEEAAQQFRRAASIWSDALGPEHVNVGVALAGLAEALLDAGEIAGAVDAIERAEPLLERGEVEPLQRARSRFVHARIVLAADRDRERAVELAEQALALYGSTEALASQELAAVEHWLARQR